MGNQFFAIGRREKSRLRLDVPAKLDLIGGIKSCVLLDISRTGARVSIDGAPKPGQCGVLSVHHVEAFGTIVWSSSKSCGVCFDEQISEKDLMVLRQTGDNSIETAQRERLQFARNWAKGG